MLYSNIKKSAATLVIMKAPSIHSENFNIFYFNIGSYKLNMLSGKIRLCCRVVVEQWYVQNGRIYLWLG